MITVFPKSINKNHQPVAHPNSRGLSLGTSSYLAVTSDSRGGTNLLRRGFRSRQSRQSRHTYDGTVRMGRGNGLSGGMKSVDLAAVNCAFTAGCFNDELLVDESWLRLMKVKYFYSAWHDSSWSSISCKWYMHKCAYINSISRVSGLIS